MIRVLFALLLLSAPMPALAQRDDDADPYGDQDSEYKAKVKSRKAKRHSRSQADDLREEADRDDEENEGPKSMASADDPNIGVGADVVAGVALLSSAKFGVDPRFFFGARFTWEFGRLIPDEYLREMFFLDVTWLYAPSKDGTAQVNVDTHLHNFTIAPAFALPFGKSFMAAYLQLGGGIDYSYSVMRLEANPPSTLSGVKPLFQYGLGLRGRPAVVANGSIRIQFRIEVTRFIRGYLHDMYFGAGVGMIF